MQVGVNQRYQLIERRAITAAPLPQKLRHGGFVGEILHFQSSIHWRPLDRPRAFSSRACSVLRMNGFQPDAHALASLTFWGTSTASASRLRRNRPVSTRASSQAAIALPAFSRPLVRGCMWPDGNRSQASWNPRPLLPHAQWEKRPTATKMANNNSPAAAAGDSRRRTW